MCMVTAKLPLTKTAQTHPMVAWKQALKTLTGQLPLIVSLTNPWKAELYYESKQVSEVTAALKKANYLVKETPVLSERDQERRKRAYLSGFFLPLRREALMGFSSKDQQLKILDMALESLEKTFQDKQTRLQWKHHIAKDRAWINEMETSIFFSSKGYYFRIKTHNQSFIHSTIGRQAKHCRATPSCTEKLIRRIQIAFAR